MRIVKKEEKQVAKKIKKGFTLNEWKFFPKKLQENNLILSEVAKKMEMCDIQIINECVDLNVFLISYLPENVQLQLVNNDNFYLIKECLQLKIVEKNNNKLKYASEQVQIEFVVNNPFKLSFSDFDIQRRVVNANYFYLQLASKEIQVEFVEKDENMLCYCSNLVQCEYVKKDPNYYDKCSVEVKRDIISLNNLSVEKISVETLEAYLSYQQYSLSLNELEDYKKQMELCSREDKGQILDYIEYLQVNLYKNKI